MNEFVIFMNEIVNAMGMLNPITLSGVRSDDAVTFKRTFSVQTTDFPTNPSKLSQHRCRLPQQEQNMIETHHKGRRKHRVSCVENPPTFLELISVFYGSSYRSDAFFEWLRWHLL